MVGNPTKITYITMGMSMEKKRIGLWVIFIVLAGVLETGLATDRQESDPILQFYCMQAGIKYDECSPAQQALNYSFTAISYIKRIDQKGEITHIDSAVTDFYFSDGSLDSQRTVISTSNKLVDFDFFYPNVFEGYQYCFFPNDTGGVELAIGFDTDSVDNKRPVGLAIIDRYEYALHRLYLFYPRRSGYKRFSRILHFGQHEGYIFPDSILEVAARAGIFATDNYHIETIISNFIIYHK